MGHRALVAYERQDGKYNVHYSHWGASDLRLRTEITESTPFGGENSEPDYVSAFVGALENNLDGQEMSGELVEAQKTSEVEPEPLETGLWMDEILSDLLDYLHHEAFYVVDSDFNVEAYRTLWFDLEYEIDRDPDPRVHATDRRAVTVGFGAIISPRWYPNPDENPDEAEPVGDGMARGKFEGAKKMLASMVTDGDISEREAYERLWKFCVDEFGDGLSSTDYDLQPGFEEIPEEIPEE